jgi:hypothetical protein
VELMYQILVTIALATLGIAAPILIACAVVYGDKLDERRWVARERAREAARKAARMQALDAWERERARRLAELGISEDRDSDGDSWAP